MVQCSRCNCCGATEGSEQQHNQDLKEIYKGVACEPQTHFRSSLLSLRKIAIFRRERSDDRKCVCGSQANKGATNSRIHHFLPQCIAFNHTFYHNALHLTRVHCATNKSNKNTGKFASLAAKTQSFLCTKFSTARLEVLPNLRHAGVFQMSTMVNLGIGFQFKSL